MHQQTMFVSRLISERKLSSFMSLLRSYAHAIDGPLLCVDGGAGLGQTAEQMIEACGARTRVLAYEPNPNNVLKFVFKHPNVELIDAALGDKVGTATFSVTADTAREGPNPYLKAGTSFVGKLGEAPAGTLHVWDVRVVRLDGELQQRGLAAIDFLKLDLQGGEVNALRGLGDAVGNVKFMWVEFGGQPGLLEWLHDNDFTVFDTEYLFSGEPNDLIRELFHITRQGKNSIGKTIFFGTRRHAWPDYPKAFDFMRRHRKMIQTDLVAVNNRYLQLFFEALAGTDSGSESEFFAPPPPILATIG